MSTASINPSEPSGSDPRHDWKGRSGSGTDWFALAARLIRHGLWGLLILGAVALFAWLVWLMLLAPRRTPVVILAPAPYLSPLPPNDWSAEDIEKLSILDGETISLRGTDTPVFKATDFFDRLNGEIERSRSLSRRLPLVVWISLHGYAQGEDSEAYLIPPKADPSNPTEWIPVKQLMDQLVQAGQQRETLLILDSSRMRVNWSIGLTNNRLSREVQAAFESAVKGSGKATRLAVINSASDQQRSLSSPDLGGSVFGHYLRLGMAGLADMDSEGGNDNGWVDVAELSRFVGKHVRGWSQYSRGGTQSPLFLSSEERPDFVVAKCVNETTLAQLMASQESLARPAASVSDTRLDSLWQTLSDLREAGLYRLEPLAFSRLEHQLLWLEQASRSGAGYQTVARREAENLSSDFAAIENRIKQLAQKRDYTSSYSLVSGRKPDLPRGITAHSLSMAEFLGTQTVASTVRLRQTLNEFADSPTALTLPDTIRESSKLSKALLADVQFLSMLDRYRFPGLLGTESIIGDVLGAQHRYRNLTLPRTAAGIAGDLRLNRIQRRLLTIATRVRRGVEDSVFLQRPVDLPEQVDRLQSQMEQTEGMSRSVRDFLQVCDLAMATAAHRARALADPRVGDAGPEADQMIDDVLVPLLGNAFSVSSRIDRINGTVAASEIDAIGQFPVTEMRSQLQAALENRQQTWRQLLNESETDQASNVGKLEAALTSPLIDTRNRKSLRDALDRLCVRLHQNRPPTFDASSDDDTDAGTDDYSTRMSAWKRHPLDSIIGREGDAKGVARMPAFIEQIETELATADQQRTLRQRMNIAVGAARKTRIAAASGFPNRNANAIEYLRDLDLQQLLHWHAEEVVRDFWGPAGGSRSFFDVAASDYRNAIKVLDSSTESIPMEIERLDRSLNLSREAAPSWLTATAEDCIQIERTDRVPSTWTLTSQSPAGFVQPSGTAVLTVQGSAGRIPLSAAVPGEAVSLPLKEAEYGVVLPADIVSRGEDLKATTVFRGHEYAGALLVDRLGGIRVDIRPPRYEKSEVVLDAPWNQLSVEFVIDGSASMKELLDGADGLSRMDVAKVALQEILFRLGLRRNVRVGVHAFGHRLGWSVDDPIRPMTRPNLTDPIDPSITPSQDVEAVLSMGPYDIQTAQWVIPKLQKIEPWGQSPLYLSVQTALQEFSELDANADRHVIVITDGANYQYIPPDVYDVPMTSDNDVRQAWSANRVPVHILGLGMDRIQEQGTIEAFTELCRDTGGRFQSLNTSTDLSQAMAALLAPATYRLSMPATENRAEQIASLGTPIEIRPAPSGAEVFGLQYEGKPVPATEDTAIAGDATDVTDIPFAYEPLVLEGGEAIRLYVDTSGTQVLAYPFDTNVAGQSEMVFSGGGSAGHVFRAHRPDRDASGKVTFTVSWQRFDISSPSDQAGDTYWRATGRPASSWIEIQPIDAKGNEAGMRYVFQDATFEADQPVPVMNLVAEEWPPNAARARIHAWTQAPGDVESYELLPPALEQPNQAVSGKLNQTIAINESLVAPLEISPGITLRIDPLASLSNGSASIQRFIVEFDGSQTDVTSIKLDPGSSLNAKPERIVRQFDPTRLMAVHTFYLDSSKDDAAEQIEVTNRNAETDGAWELADGYIDIAIPNPGGLLPLRPTRPR